MISSKKTNIFNECTTCGLRNACESQLSRTVQCHNGLNMNYVGKPWMWPPSQDASGKWRFCLGFPMKNVTILEVTGILWGGHIQGKPTKNISFGTWTKRSSQKNKWQSNYVERGTLVVPWETTEELLHIREKDPWPFRKRRNQFSLVKRNRKIKRTNASCSFGNKGILQSTQVPFQSTELETESIRVYFDSKHLYFESIPLYPENIRLYFESILLYLESILLDFENLLLYFESLLLYFESVLFYFESLLLYFANLLLYFESIPLYFDSIFLYFEGITFVLWKYTFVPREYTFVLWKWTLVLWKYTFVLWKYTFALWKCNVGLWAWTNANFRPGVTFALLTSLLALGLGERKV